MVSYVAPSTASASTTYRGTRASARELWGRCTLVSEPGPATACVHCLGWPLCWRLTAAYGRQALIWDKKFKPYVMEYAADEEKFFKVRSWGLRAASI